MLSRSRDRSQEGVTSPDQPRRTLRLDAGPDRGRRRRTQPRAGAQASSDRGSQQGHRGDAEPHGQLAAKLPTPGGSRN
eukprot:15434211-Alexandrium_andersonii.AAC.1